MHLFRFTCTLWACVCGTFLAASSALARAPDLILTNGKIVTVDDRFSMHQAVAIEGERIVAVGTTDEIRSKAGDATRVIDLKGRTVIPGLIDTHSHIMRASQLWKYELRLDGIISRNEAIARIREQASRLQRGDWLMTMGGWIEDQFVDDPRGFTLDELDRIAPRNPVYLDVNYSHRYVNSAFLRLAGIPLVNKAARSGAAALGSITTDKKGLTEDIIERDAKGRATGKILGGGYGNALALSLMPMLEGQDGKESLKAIVRDANAVGLTGIYDGGGVGVMDPPYQHARQLAAENELTLRVFRARQEMARTPEEAEREALNIGKVKPFAGNDYYDEIGIGEAVYAPAIDGFERPLTKDDDTKQALATIFEATARGGWNLHLHSVHDESMNFALDVMETIPSRHMLKPLRWLFIHADLVDQPLLERMRPLNMGLSIRSNMVMGGEAWRKNQQFVGPRALQVPDLRAIQDSGVVWSFGSEAPRITVLSPFASLAWAVNGTTFYDKTKVLSRTISREEALIAHTRGGAYHVFSENKLGQIRAGFLADMVVLNRDYMTVPASELFGITPEMTIVGGKVVYERK